MALVTAVAVVWFATNLRRSRVGRALAAGRDSDAAARSLGLDPTVFLWTFGLLDGQKNPAIFTAVNSNTMERLHVLHPFNAERAQAWSDRAVAVIKATVAGELLPRAYDDPTDWRCRVCGHRERCWR